MASSQRVSSLIYRASPSPSPSSPYVCTSCRVNHQSILISGPLRSSQRASLSSSSQARNSNRNKNLPFTEKLRRKIWGTDNPPGLADPYGGPSFLEKHWAQREQRYKEKDEAIAQQEALEAAERELQLEEEERARGQQFPTQTPPPQHPQEEVLRDNRHASRRIAGAPAGGEEALGNNVEDVGEYTPATTWDGLMHIGHSGHWQDVAPTDHDTYQPWFVNYVGTPSSGVRAITREEVESLFRDAADHAGVELEGTTELASQPVDLTNAATFQIIKSFRALTGFAFTDPFLSSLGRSSTPTTYADLINHYLEATTAKATATNVYESLAAKPDLATQPNVLILPRRETPVDKDKEVGRWKVIEKELAHRGLPVLGRLPSS